MIRNFSPIFSRAVLALVLCLCVLPCALADEDKTPVITHQAATFDLDLETRVWTGKGNATADYGDMNLTADTMVLNTDSLDFEAMGNIVFKWLGQRWRAEKISGNLKTGIMKMDGFRMVDDPWYLTGSRARRSADGVIILNNAVLTSCDLAKDQSRSHWALKSDSFTYRPNGRYTAKKALYSINRVPVLYMPTVTGNTRLSEGGFEVSTGYEGDWGAMLRLGKTWRVNDSLRTRLGLDLFSRRGVGVSSDSELRTEHSATSLSLYGINDNNPESDRTVGGKDYNGRFKVEEDRFRVLLKHRTDLSPNLTFRSQINWRSDNDFLEEFYRREYRRYKAPPTYADLTYTGARGSLSLSVRPRLNDFETVVERLPELRLTMPRQRFFNSSLYYQGATQLSRLRMNWKDYDLPRDGAPAPTDPRNYATTRLDTVHFLYAPFRYGAVSFVPRAGVRVVYYGDTSVTELSDGDLNDIFEVDDDQSNLTLGTSVVNYDDDGGRRFRPIYELGLEASFKTYRTWANDKRPLWGIDGLRHVVEPYMNYTWIPAPNVDKENVYYFDVVDRIDDTHFVRLGLRQRLQTRRQRQIQTFARLENYYDFHFEPETGEHQNGDLGTVLELSPRESLSFWVKVLIDTAAWNVDVVRLGSTIGEPKGVHGAISYVYRDNNRNRLLYSMGSELTQILTTPTFPIDTQRTHNFRFDLDVPLTMRTRIKTNHLIDLRGGRLARQQYEIERDLHCWTGILRVTEESSDLSVMLLFSLKALPKVRLDTSF